MKIWHVIRTDLQVSVYSGSRRECNAYLKKAQCEPGFLEVKQGQYRKFSEIDMMKIFDDAYSDWREAHPGELFFDAFHRAKGGRYESEEYEDDE